MTRYWRAVRDEADRLGTDGCTMGSAAFRECCLRHDVEYRTGVRFGSDSLLTKQEADERMLSCMQSRSRFGWYAPLGWMRYGILKLFGQKAWDSNAECRADEARRRAAISGEGDQGT